MTGSDPPGPGAGQGLSGARSAAQALAWSRELVDPALHGAVDTLPAGVRRMAGYHLGWWEADGRPRPADTTGSGKAIRPALTLLAAEAIGAEATAGLPGAVAVELVHNFSLIHDDVIDGDLTRRHRPTVWSVFGSGKAIVAGDALLTLAFEVLSDSGHPYAGEAVRTLHSAVLALAEGEYSDLAFEDRTDVDLAECVAMAEGKSGALMGCACAIGGQLAGATPAQVTGLYGFGVRLGVAFQIADDVLGIWGDPTVTGKPIHSDLSRRKKSLPLVAALASGSDAGDELAARYDQDPRPSDAELAGLVERAGGRAWCQERGAELLTAALQQLHAVVGQEHRAAAELAALGRLAAFRDR